MKMADAEKSEELVNSKTPPETPLEVAAGDKTLKTETSPSEKEGDGLLQTDPGLLSAMPCLLMELRRDSPESQQASTESEKQTPSRTYESDSSNHCMLSPSSSGHLADSDTLSSAEENGAPRAGASCAAEGGDSNSGAGGVVVAGGRKSRRSRSESEMSSTTSMAAKKNRWQATGADKQNGRLAKVKGHRSQKHKERIRLLRQKREAAARKKYNLLQDSSTSDSDLTCDSSTSSSDDDKEVSGSGKTITGNIPEHSPPPQDSNENPMDNEDNLSSEPLPTNSTPRHICRTTAGFSRAEGSAGVTGQIQGLLDSGTSWDRNCIGNVLEEAMNRFAVMQRQTEERFRVWMDKLTRLDTDDETKPCSEPTEPQIQMIGQRVPPTTQSNACMQMSGSHLHSQAYVPYVVSHQNIDSESFQIPFNNNHPPTSFSENGNPASQDLDHSDGPPVLAHYDISDTNSDPEVVSVNNLLAAAVAQELKTYRTQDMGANSWQNKGDLGSSMETGHINAEFATGDLSTCGPLQVKEEINIASSDSEVEIVGVQENTRCIHPRGGVIHSISSWKHGPISQYNSTRQSHLWTAVSPQPNWSSPPEVVDLTLDEDARRKYLL